MSGYSATSCVRVRSSFTKFVGRFVQMIRSKLGFGIYKRNMVRLLYPDTMHFFDLGKKLFFFSRDKHNSFARCSCSPCSAYSMDITFWLFRNVKIDDKTYIVHIQSSRSYIGSDKDFETSIFKIFERSISFALTHITIEHTRFVSSFFDSKQQGLGISFGLGKHQNFVLAMLMDQCQQIDNFVRMCHRNKSMIDFVYGHSFTNFDKFIIGNMSLDNSFDLRTDSSTKRQRLF